MTTAIVRMPSSRAHAATTGAAPVPVPPPMPAVIKTISAFRSASVMASLLSRAAASPISGREPAPRPRVLFSPIWIRVAALDCSDACASVLITTNSTPSRPELIILLMALPPPPPTPTTMIFAKSSKLSSISNTASASISYLYLIYALIVIYDSPR